MGPWGHFYEPQTGIVVIKGQAYHPRLMQWLTPQWDRVTKAPERVTDVYIYRFRDNDPVNPGKQDLSIIHGDYE